MGKSETGLSRSHRSIDTGRVRWARGAVPLGSGVLVDFVPCQLCVATSLCKRERKKDREKDST
jgi:hypothetical protein